MTYHFSRPAEVLFSKQAKPRVPRSDQSPPSGSHEDINIGTLIVGSGYGAAMAALAIAEHNNEKVEKSSSKIVVLERGDEYLPEDFPRSIADAPPYLGYRTKQSTNNDSVDMSSDDNKNRLRELWDIRIGDGAVTISGSGLGGTSLVNASVVLRPEDHVFDTWPETQDKEPWATRLSKHYPKIEQLLGVTTTPDAESFSKYKALQHTVHSLDTNAQVAPAPVSINFTKPTAHSVEHEPCNLCGNCIIGCHSGAKQSLNLNAWPLAVQLGVELFTGVTVLRVEQNPNYSEHSNPETNAPNKASSDQKPWLIHACMTRNKTERLVLQADRVVLAAGTLGSSSILYRSHTLSLSNKLGQHFSVNGDTVKFSIGQSHTVNAVADAPENTLKSPPGPTIIGVGRVSMNGVDANEADANKKLIVEDGAIPFPMASIWNEMLTTQFMVSRYAGNAQSAWYKKNPDHDPLAVSSDMAAHSQVFLTMGRDNGNGSLIPNKTLTTGSNGVSVPIDDIELVPYWDSTLDDYHKRVDDVFTSAPATAYQGGLYVPNPAWQLIPPSVAAEIQGADDIPSNVVSVHPLGGCIMGQNAENGVVNCQGQVFCNNTDDKQKVYDNLYVLDGAIIPAAIGANPLLTISALSYALASDIDTTQVSESSQAAAFPILEQRYRDMPKRTRASAIPQDAISTKAIFRERLFWDLSKDRRKTDTLIKQLQTIFEIGTIPALAKVLILDINFSFDKNKDGTETNLEAWMQHPNVPLDAKAQLRVSTNSLLHTSEDIELPEKPIATFNGIVNLGVNSDSNHLPSSMSKLPWLGKYKTVRAANAIVRYAQFRWMDVLEKILERRENAGNNKTTLLTSIKGYLRFANVHSRWHYLVYEFQSTGHDDELEQHQNKIDKDDEQSYSSPNLQLAGCKTLAYRSGGDTLWDALTNLPVVISSNKGKINATFTIDLVRIVSGASPLQITNAVNTPQALLAVGQLGSYFLRTLVQTHFWSLAALPYKRFPNPEKVDDDRLEIPDARIALTKTSQSDTQSTSTPEYGVIKQTFESDGKLARLMHYTIEQTESSTRPAIMFTHGLAHGTRLFWTPDTAENYLQYFLKNGFDVWLLDHRASANYRRKVDNKHNVEDLANDVAWAVKTIFEDINASTTTDGSKLDSPHDSVDGEPKLVHVLAHCVGAAATSMAVLGGQLQQERNPERTMLASFSLHAVTPWLFGSAENRARQNLWWFIDQSGAVSELDSTTHNKTSWTHVLFDRIAHSMMTDKDRIQWGFKDKLKDPNGLGYARGNYSRYRFFYGPEFNFHNVSRKLRNQFHYNAGKTPIQSVKQMFVSVVGKRLVNSQMENVYLTAQNLSQRWQFPTFFFHGHDNKVFDIESSRMSAYSLAQFRKTNRPDTVINTDRPTQLGEVTEQATEQATEQLAEPANREPLLSDSYMDYGVRLKTLEDYGHMDMIFGNNATREIGPHILDFLRASEQHNQSFSQHAGNDFSAFSHAYKQKKAVSISEDQPVTSKIDERLPSAGPVLSHVSDHSIRIWLESDDYDTQSLSDVLITSNAGAASKIVIRKPDSDALNENAQGRFWLFDLDNPANISGTVNVSIDYGLGNDANALRTRIEKSEVATVSGKAVNCLQQPPAYTHATQPSYKPYESNFAAMPWFQREFGKSSEQQQTSISIALGSCLHPGSTFERDRSDGIFEGIWQQAINDTAENKSLDLMLLLGDQIYADASAELFDPVDYYERYRKRYRTAWTGTWMRRVMSHLPTHFVVDDHEIHDNFAGDSEKATKFNLEHARREAYNFQLHVPEHKVDEPNTSGLALWHSFNRLGTPFFCFDTRFARSVKNNDALKAIFGDQSRQWQDFLQWLSANKDAEHLVLASGSPLCPVKKNIVKHPELAEHSDGVLAYPEFLHKLVENVSTICPKASILWLAGDPHFSSTAQVRIKSTAGYINITSITASGLYAPIPFANADPYEYLWDSEQSLILGGRHDVVLEFSQQLLSGDYRQFTRLDMQSGSKLIDVACYGADGESLGIARTLTLKQAN